MTFVETLEPHALWKQFDRILEIPRASKDEGRMRDYVLSVAGRVGLGEPLHAVEDARQVEQQPEHDGQDLLNVTDAPVGQGFHHLPKPEI